MKGIRSKIITDEETVRMHTNFAEFKNVIVGMAYPDIATYSMSDGVIRVHTNTLRGWGIFVSCLIPKSLLKAGQKYCISLVSNIRIRNIYLVNDNGTHSATIVNRSFVGKRISSVVTLSEATLVDGLGIKVFLDKNNADYELSDFRIWEIDDVTTGGGNS